MNALRHGLTYQFYAFSEADRLAYTDFNKTSSKPSRPSATTKRDLAVSITRNGWRLHRARAMESNIQGLGQHHLADNYYTGSPGTEVVVTQAQTWLISHQATRNAGESKAREDPELVVAQSLRNKEPLAAKSKIQVNGFEFSTTNLIAGLNRKSALESARSTNPTTGTATNPSPNPSQKPPDPPIAPNAVA